MITVVSDTSPLHYLLLVGAIDVLPVLFQEVLLPRAVLMELQQPRTPQLVFEWAAQLPAWVRIQEPSRIDETIGLGAGETAAISLAVELHAPAILMDERRGRFEAEKRGLLPVGTLNLLDAADARGLLDFEEMARRLQQTNFRIDPAIIDKLIQRARQRRSA